MWKSMYVGGVKKGIKVYELLYILLANFQLGTLLPRQHPYTNMCSLGDIHSKQ